MCANSRSIAIQRPADPTPEHLNLLVSPIGKGFTVVYIYIYISCAWTPNNAFCQKMLWKSVLCKFRRRLRGVYSTSTLIGMNACTFFLLLFCLLAGLNNANCYARPRHLTPSNPGR